MGGGQRAGLRPGEGRSVLDIETRFHLQATLTLGEFGALVGMRGHVVCASNKVVDVLAIVGAPDRVVANFHAEETSANERAPILALSDDASCAGKIVGEDQATKWVAEEISAVGVEFASVIRGVHANTLLIESSGELDVGRCLHELNALEGAGRHDTGSVTWLAAVSDYFTLDVANLRTGDGGTPETKVINAVDEGSLAKRIGTFGRAVANVVPSLRSTTTRCRWEGIDLVWEVGVCEVVAVQRQSAGSSWGRGYGGSG